MNLNTETLAPRTEHDETHRISAPELAMLIVLGLTLAGNCLLVSAGQGIEAGHQAWRPGSVLRVLTELMTLNHQYPTARGVEIKWLAQGLGAAAAVVVASIAWFLRSRREGDEVGPWPVAPSKKGALGALSPVAAAQIALVLFSLFCVASALWSRWPAGSFGEGLRQVMLVAYAIAIARTLSRSAAERGAQILLGILAVTAIIGIWYYYERNPVQRLKFPIGNPIFLAACLLPGVTIALGLIAAAVFRKKPEQRAEPLPSTDGSRWARIVAGVLAGLALVAFLLALGLSDSRGPGLGLGVGLLAALFLILPRFWRWLPPLGVAGILALAWAFKLWPVSWLMSRPDTVRFRLYAWKYALAMFLGRPDIGRGQGSYLLVAQGMSRADAEADPAAFVSEVLGHAHNEWLQVLAETGAIGFALLATALGVTAWAAVLMLRRGRQGSASDVLSPGQRWCLLGLLAAFVAIIVEATTDVSLRLPGLPVIFYTVLALMWALSRAPGEAVAAAVAEGAGERGSGGAGDGEPRSIDEAAKATTTAAEKLDSILSAQETYSSYAPAAGPGSEMRDSDDSNDSPGRRHAFLRVGGLVLGLVAAWGMFTVSLRDWTGALADPLINEYAGKHQWVEAVSAADVAATRRLSMDASVAAIYQAAKVTHDAALDRVRQMRDMYEHLGEGGDRATIAQMAAEDADAFKTFFSIGVGTGAGLIERMPGYPYVAGYVADLWLARQDFEALSAAFAGQPQTQPSISTLEEARRWLTIEYQRDRLNAEVALRLLQLTGEATPAGTAARINLLRLPLRRGAVPANWEPALIAVMRDPNFGPVLNESVAHARAAAADPSVPWSDGYLPETLRLAALASKVQGRLQEAATLCGQAAKLSERIRDRWPAAVSYARREQAFFLLLARPNEPRIALAAMQQAVEAWPPDWEHDRLVTLYRDLSLYQLAAGDEAGARQTIMSVVRASNAADTAPPEALDRNVGYGYAEVASTVALLRPDLRPPAFDTWLQKAIELAPGNPQARLLVTRVMLERGQEGPAVEQLAELEKILGDAEHFGPVLERLMQEFPDSQAVRDIAVQRFGPAVTQPASAPEER